MDTIPALVLFAVVIGGLYHFLGGSRRPGEMLSILLAVTAAFPLVHAGTVIWKELDRWQYGRTETGVVVGKLSSTGEAGTRTIGGRPFSRRIRHRRNKPEIYTGTDFRADDVVARMLLTGSKHAYFVEYRHPCESGAGCYQREEVRHPVWSQLAVGQPVEVRTVRGQPERARLDFNSPLSIAAVKLAMGIALLLAARALRPRRSRIIIA